MEPNLEQEKGPPNESSLRFKAIADSIYIGDPEQFTEAEIDYSKTLWNARADLRRRIRKGKADIVVLIQLGPKVEPQANDLFQLNPDTLKTLLAYRLPNRIYGHTWAPIMGKVEEADLSNPFSRLHRIKFGEFLRLVPVVREEKEEKVTAQLVAPAGIMAFPYFDKESGRIIHVAIKVYPIIPQLKERDPLIVAEGDREHSRMQWFDLAQLPVEQMAEGSKKAMKNALAKLAEIQKP